MLQDHQLPPTGSAEHFSALKAHAKGIPAVMKVLGVLAAYLAQLGSGVRQLLLLLGRHDEPDEKRRGSSAESHERAAHHKSIKELESGRISS